MKIKDERDELEQLLNSSNSNLQENVIHASDTPELTIEDTMNVNFDEIKQESIVEARQIIINSMGFALTENMINENSIIQSKMEVDIFSLSGMLYQLRCNEAMQRALMEEVKHGAMHPRYFEVFSGLSKTIGDLNKQLLQTVEVIKNGYKDIKLDIKEKQTESLNPGNSSNLLPTNDGGLVSYGTKELIQQVKKLNDDKRIDSEKIDE
jgi:hypothetical protein